MPCPSCNSDSAVDKAEAWDALALTPPKIQDELNRLRNLKAVARDVAIDGLHPGDEKTVVVTVRIDDLNKLRAEFGVDPI